MLTFLDHKGNEIGALTTFKYTNSVNGERSLSGTVHGNLEIEKGWGVRFEDEYYKVIYAKPKSLGKLNIVQFDAVHQFFWDFDKSSVYSELDGSYPFQTFLDHIFNGSGYRYNLEVEVGSLRKQNFGLKKRLELFNDLIKHAGVEFQVRGKVVRILERTGTDLSTVVRKKLNLNDLSVEKRIGDFITYQKGLGAWYDENDHSKGRLEVEYVSPLAAIYGRLEGEPYIDERFTIANNFLEVLKKTVEDSYSISVQLTMEDLHKAGYRYTRPLAGDYITVIDEDINFKERVRIVSFETEYDIKGQAIDHTVTCNDIGSVKKQSVGYSSLKSSVANISKETESAIQTANRALVSADGKTTVYFGTEFPQDIPKGTLTKGDTLYLEVGDTTKMYYWNGAEWLEPPVVNDVEAFKESINADIAQVNQSMQAQSEEHDRQVADILYKTQSVEELANQAKSDAASALVRANQVKTEAIADARAQVATVSQALNTAKSELQSAIASADQKARDSQASATALRNDLNVQAGKILEQARAQTALTNRVSTVETLADGTKTTVAELSKTVSKATGDIASVSSRTRMVEDTLSQTRTQYEALTQTVNAQTGQIDNINRKTADLQSGIDGVTERFENLRIEDNLLLNSSFNNNLEKWNGVGVAIIDGKGRITGQLNRTKRTFQSIKNQTATDDIDQTYIASVLVKVTDFEAGPTNPFLAFYVNGNKNNSSNTWFGAKYLTTNFISGVNNQGWVRFSTIFQVPVPRDQIARLDFEIYARDFTGEVEFEKVSLRRGDIDFGWQPSSEDLRSEIATYKRTAEESSAELSRQIQLADGKAVEAKSYAQQTATQFSTRLSSLETYKDGEGTRASQYLTASREETARQLEAERTSISANYVAKSTYIEDVRGTTQRLNEIKTTADTAKQNLATYQNTVDRKLSELTTSTQTLDGKISTASAKVDTVAGQIRTEINEVERKIPTSLGGQNLIKNGGFPVDLAHWTDYRGTHFSFTHHAKYKDGEKSLFRLDNRAAYQYTAATNRFALKRNTDYSLSFYGLATSNLSSMDVWYLPRKNGETGPFTNQFILVNARVLSSEEFEYVTVTFNSKDYDEGFLRFDNNGSTDGQMSSLFFGEVMLAEGIIARTYEPSQEEVMEEVKSIKTTITQTSQGVEQLSTRLATTVGKVTTAETKISQLINDVSSKVSQTDHDTLTGRMTSAETAITQNAQEISRRLTSTQVESAITGKGYQTKADVDNNITGRGYITSSALQPYATTTVLENKVRETADSFSRSITETRALIPSGESNLVKWGRPGETSEYANASLANHIFFYSGNIKMYVIRNLSTSAEKNVGLNRFKVERNTDYTLYFKGFNNSAIISMDVWFLKRTRESSADFDEAQRLVNRKLSFLGAEEVTVTFNTGNFDEGYLRFDNNGSTADGRSADLYFGDVSVKKGKSNNGWSPSVEELATVTALHSVRDTVDSHTRTIGAVGTAGSILDNVSKVTQTAAGLVQEVSGSNGLKTQVSQLAGSYAIQNLTKAGDILGQINLNQDGSVRINEGLISIGERTYIKDGVITSAKIGKGQIGTAHIGEIDAGIAKIINLDVSNIKGLDAEFIKAKIENAFIEWMKGKTITAQNEAMSIGLNDAFIRFKDNAKIEFNSSNNAIVRRRGTHTGFVHIADTIDDAVYACIGVTSSGDGVNSWSSGRFAGIRCFRSAQGTSHNAIDDRIEVYGDTVMFLDDFSLARGFVMYPTRLPNGKIVDLNRLVTSVEHLWNCWGHAKNGGMRPPQAIMDERATYQNYHYVGGF